MSERTHAVDRSAKIFALIKQAAERDEVCPINTILAERFSCSRGAVANSFSLLIANGMIELIQTTPARVVGVSSINKRTAGRTESTKSSLAELLSDGLEIPEAAMRLGISKGRAYAVMAEIQEDLGEQAA